MRRINPKTPWTFSGRNYDQRLKETFAQCRKCFYDSHGKRVSGKKDGHGIANRYFRGACNCEKCFAAYRKQRTQYNTTTRRNSQFFNRLESRLEDKLQQRYEELA